MAAPAELGPATVGLEGRRSTQLSYGAKETFSANGSRAYGGEKRNYLSTPFLATGLVGPPLNAAGEAITGLLVKAHLYTKCYFRPQFVYEN